MKIRYFLIISAFLLNGLTPLTFGSKAEEMEMLTPEKLRELNTPEWKASMISEIKAELKKVPLAKKPTLELLIAIFEENKKEVEQYLTSSFYDNAHFIPKEDYDAIAEKAILIPNKEIQQLLIKKGMPLKEKAKEYHIILP
jgi:hypothetical protein